MDKKNVIELAKFIGALTIGGVIASAATPAIKDLFKMNKKNDIPEIDSDDIEDEDIEEDN